MRPNPLVQQTYELHTRHIPKETIHLGDAETIDDVVLVDQILSSERFSLAKCCTDGAPTLQLAKGNRVRRLRLALLSESERAQAINYL